MGIKKRRGRLYLIFLCSLIVAAFFIFSNRKHEEANGAGPENSGLQTSRYNLLLITIDTLRADHLGCYGYHDVKTPVIDALAREGILFSQAFTPVPITLPSHASIMTGLYPIQHGVQSNGNYVLSKGATTLAELMKSHGYLTCACVGSFVLNSLFGLDQGFDTYDDYLKKRKAGESPLDSDRKAEEVTKSALHWLQENHTHPFFLWVHYFDPHALYLPPSPFREEYSSHLYDGEIAYTDKCLGDLFRGLREMGVMDKTIVILTADHGEGLGEHGEPTHTVFIYDSTLHVPLIISLPSGYLVAGRKAGSQVMDMVSTLDIFPTIVDLFTLKPAGVQLDHLPGRSLVPFMSEKCPHPDREIFCETLYPEINFGWSRIEGVRMEDWKYIKAPRSELYHLPEDPGEKRNLWPENGAEKDAHCMGWKKRLAELKKTLREEGIRPQKVADRAALRKLESLGYVQFSQSPGSAGSSQKKSIDPKDMVYLIGILDKGIYYYHCELYEKAHEAFSKILEVNPANVSASYYLACIEEKMGKYEQARDRLLHIVSLVPDYLDAHNYLGVIYIRLGQFEKAIKEFEKALQQGKYMEIYYNLGVLYRKTGQRDKAVTAMRAALELDPNYMDALNFLGEMAMEGGRIEEAKGHFSRVLNLDPENPDAHNNLGLVHLQESKPEEALKEFIRVLQTDPNNAEAYNNLGSLYLSLKENVKAETAFRKALSKNPHYLKALINLGNICFQEGKIEEAIQSWEKILQKKPSHAEALINIGTACYQKGELGRAREMWEKAKRLTPDNPKIHYNLALIFFNQGDYPRSQEELEEALRLEPDNAQARILMETITQRGR